jgi:ABC-type sugar transport system ATPase subunit
LDDYVLRLTNITKEFPGVKALDKMMFNLKRGEVHALIGENGAGKSTLMKVLSGIYIPDSGEIVLDGETVKFKNTVDAESHGISIVHQELAVFNTSTVAENVLTTKPPKNRLGSLITKGCSVKFVRYSMYMDSPMSMKKAPCAV